MVEKILSFLFGLPSKLDGMVRTVVVTGETSETRAVVFPSRRMSCPSLNVVYGTYLGTDATFHTPFAIHAETLVGDEKMGKETADESRIDAGPVPDVYFSAFFLPFCNGRYIAFEFLLCRLNLPLFIFGRVYIHERQAHIRFRHDEREDGVQVHAPPVKIGFEDVHGLAGGVSGRAKGIGIMALGADIEFFNELAHNCRWAPSVHGKAETDTFSLPEIVFYAGVLNMMRDVNKWFSCGFGQLCGSPSGVSCP